jgi:NTP pyrophosphatase (non-canonical NTP hydrolase)
MTFREYQIKAKETANYPDQGHNFIYAALGLSGEAGEVADKIKKIWRDKNKQVNDEDRQEIAQEIGDVLWYLSQLAEELGIDFDEVARLNLDKTHSRLQRGVLHGSGDNR